jgi:hypothetical protein
MFLSSSVIQYLLHTFLICYIFDITNSGVSATSSSHVTDAVLATEVVLTTTTPLTTSTAASKTPVPMLLDAVVTASES